MDFSTIIIITIGFIITGIASYKRGRMKAWEKIGEPQKITEPPPRHPDPLQGSVVLGKDDLSDIELKTPRIIKQQDKPRAEDFDCYLCEDRGKLFLQGVGPSTCPCSIRPPFKSRPSKLNEPCKHCDDQLLVKTGLGFMACPACVDPKKGISGKLKEGKE